MTGRGKGRYLVLCCLAVWSLLPLVVMGLVSMSGGWHFPSLTGSSPSLRSWISLWETGGRLMGALFVSVGLGLCTGLLAASSGLALGRALSGLKGWARAVGAGCAFLPVAAPPVALGLGLQYTFLRVGLGGTALGVLLAHLIPAVGYTSLYFLSVFSAFDKEIENEARRLGAGRLQTQLLVTLPLLRRPFMEAFILGFLVSWAQVPLTLLVGQGSIRTLTVEVLSWMRAGQDPLAAAGALGLTIPPLLLMALITLAVRRAEVVAP